MPHIPGQRQGPAAGSHVEKALPGDIPGSVNRLDVPGRIRARAPHPLSELVHHILHRIQRLSFLLVAVEELPLSVKRILHPLQGSNIIGIPLFHSAHAGNAPHRLNRLHAQALRAARRVGKTSIQIAPESSGIRLALLNLLVNRGHQQHQRLLVQHLIPVDIHRQQIGHVQRVGAPDILKPTPLGKSIRPPRPHDGIGNLLRTLGILQQIGRTRVPATFLPGYAIHYPAGNLLLFSLNPLQIFIIGVQRLLMPPLKILPNLVCRNNICSPQIVGVLVNLAAYISISVTDGLHQAIPKHISPVMFASQIKAVQSILAPEFRSFLSALSIHGPGPQHIHQPGLLILSAPLFSLCCAVHHHSPLVMQGFRIRQLRTELRFGRIFRSRKRGRSGFHHVASIQKINVGCCLLLSCSRFHLRQVKSGGSLALRQRQGGKRKIQRHIRSVGPVKGKIVVHGEKYL